MQSVSLKRNIGLFALFFYGLGTMVGGGIYALLGKVSGYAGSLAPLSFLIAGLLALFNAFTYAELSSRLPFSAGAAAFVDHAFRNRKLTQLVAWAVIFTGVVSAATLSKATIGFLQDLYPLPFQVSLVSLILLMGLVAIWGVRQTVVVVVGITLIEVLALVYIIVAAWNYDASFISTQLRAISFEHFPLVISGVFLAFYAFIGFEDMVNMAEEVKDVRKNMPRAILLAITLTTVLYVLVSVSALKVVSLDELIAARTPLALIFKYLGGAAWIMILISILTGLNGALVQIVMASRIMYGLAKRGKLSKMFASVNRKTQTPILATIVVIFIIMFFALLLPLLSLAKLTSGVILAVFAVMNLSLLVIKFRGEKIPEGAKSYSIVFPIVGFVSCVFVLLFQVTSLFL